VVVSNIIVAAIITPGSDPVSLAAMAIPIIALFYLGVFAATWSMKSAGRDAALNQLDAPPC
jgi:Sec-independent protein secretion pathway component TatC